MSYSAFFTSGLNLACQPHTYDSLSEAQNVPSKASASHVRTRRRQSSLSITTPPLSSVKPPMPTANELSKTSLRTPSRTSPTSPGARMTRRKTVSNGQEAPALPAPTTPLPPLPPHLAIRTRRLSPPVPSDMPTSPAEETYPSSPLSTEPVAPSTTLIGSLRSNPARRSSSALPPFSVVRGLFTQSTLGNSSLMEERDSSIQAN